MDPPDFLICRLGEVVGGLEVTTAMHEGLMRLGGQLARREDAIESKLLEYSWMAAISWTDADLRRWDFDRFAMLVKAVEQRGFQSDRQADSLIRGELRKIGVTSLHRVNQRREGVQRIYLNPEGYAAFVDPLAVDRLINKKGDVKRALLESIIGERHLFVWVHWSVKAVNALFGHPSHEPLDLPPWIDEVWVGKLWGHVTEVWHRSTGTPWEVLGQDG